jgi:hypothetical protein
MTEAEWLDARSPEPMFDHLNGTEPPIRMRRFRLFSLACCTRMRRCFTEPRLQSALTFAERHADRGVRAKRGRAELALDVDRLYREVDAERDRLMGDQRTPRFCQVLILIGSCLATQRLLRPSHDHRYHPLWEIVADSTAWELMLEMDPAHPPLWQPGRDLVERAAQADLLRDVFGNPFRTVALDSRWRSEAVRLLADGIQADRAYDRLPILADALEEAGCDNAELLAHCRGPGPHVFGCWALDLVRGVY